MNHLLRLNDEELNLVAAGVRALNFIPLDLRDHVAGLIGLRADQWPDGQRVVLGLYEDIHRGRLDFIERRGGGDEDQEDRPFPWPVQAIEYYGRVEYDDGCAVRLRIEWKEDSTRRQRLDALEDMYPKGWPCYCAHDCCGHDGIPYHAIEGETEGGQSNAPTWWVTVPFLPNV